MEMVLGGFSARKMSIRRRDTRKFREPPEKSLRAEDIIMKQTTLDPERTMQAISLLGKALEVCGIENEIATFLKQQFDTLYGPCWQCIVGRNFGSHLDCIEYVQLSISKISVIIFRCR